MIPRKGKKTPINVKKSNARTILKGITTKNIDTLFLISLISLNFFLTLNYR